MSECPLAIRHKKGEYIVEFVGEIFVLGGVFVSFCDTEELVELLDCI